MIWGQENWVWTHSCHNETLGKTLSFSGSVYSDSTKGSRPRSWDSASCLGVLGLNMHQPSLASKGVTPNSEMESANLGAKGRGWGAAYHPSSL